MHKIRHLHTLVAMRVASGLLLLSCLLCVSAITVAIYSLYEINRPLLLVSLGLLGGFLVTALGYRYYASSSRCSLCMGPVLLSRQCSRSKKAQRSFGSYRLRVARDIIFKNSFCCPYCGEPTKCEVKKAPASPTPQDSQDEAAVRR